MSNFWSGFIVVLSLANIFACYWLIRWTAKPRAEEAASDETTGHVWDDDLTEYNKPMPRWWLWLFYLTIIFALVYLVLYPGLGKFDGLLNWSQYSRYEAQVEQARERYAPLYDKYAATPIPQLAKNEEARATGGRIFANNCAVCHGSDGRGARGYPNLTDGSWLYGGSPDAIKTTLLNGRSGMMPPWGSTLGDDEIREVATYVRSLSGLEPADSEVAQAGQQNYQTYCVACHGTDGTGNQALGAPDLTDDAWLYGRSMAAVEHTLREGRQGRMPAFGDLLGEQRVHVVAAYVYGLSKHDEPPGDKNETVSQ